MKKLPLNSAAIGAFVLGSLAIAVISIILFGSGRWFGAERESFVCFFEDAVDGLQIGSKVKLKGVPIGEVKQILLRFQPQDGVQEGDGATATKPLIPVIIEVDVQGVGMDMEEQSDYLAQIEDGLRASLGISNFITGILQVNLDYRDDVEPAESLVPFEYDGATYRVIPTLPSQMAQATNDLLGVVSNISKADFKGVVDGLKQVLSTLSTKLDEFEVKGMNKALDSFEKRMNSEKIDEALESFSEAAAAVAEATKSVQAVAETLNAQLDDNALGGAVASAEETFQSLRGATEKLDSLMASGKDVPQQLEESLREIGEMAETIKELAAYLAEYPNSVIFGRKDRKEDDGNEDRADRDRRPWRAGPRG